MTQDPSTGPSGQKCSVDTTSFNARSGKLERDKKPGGVRSSKSLLDGVLPGGEETVPKTPLVQSMARTQENEKKKKNFAKRNAKDGRESWVRKSVTDNGARSKGGKPSVFKRQKIPVKQKGGLRAKKTTSAVWDHRISTNTGNKGTGTSSKRAQGGGEEGLKKWGKNAALRGYVWPGDWGKGMEKRTPRTNYSGHYWHLLQGASHLCKKSKM